MTTPNIDELIDRLYDWHNTSAEQNRLDMQKADDLLQSQEERIAELEAKLKAADDIDTLLCKEIDTLRAQLAAIAATEPVFYEFQWTNPGNQPHQPESIFVWARVEPAWNGTVQQKVDELLAYRYDDKPTYRVRALFTRPMPAQDVTELVEALEKLARLGNGEHYGNSDGNMIARDALSKYKGAK